MKMGRERVTKRLERLAQKRGKLLSCHESVTDGFGQLVKTSAATTTNEVTRDTVNVTNARGQLERQTVGTQAPVVYAYDSLGNLIRETVLLDAAAPQDTTKNRIVTHSYTCAEEEDGLYRVVTTRRNNAEGTMLESLEKTLVSRLSSTLESKQIAIDERGNVTTAWTAYGEGSGRIAKRQIPTSDVTAETVLVDGFTVKETDTSGITVTHARRYLEHGLKLTDTDGRGFATVTLTDVAGRPIKVTDAAGNSTETVYNAHFDAPAEVTDALGNTACYAYDLRGNKIAAWGTGIQPALYGYNDADQLTTLTTFRADGETITADPRERTDGDTTTWVYDPATGLELSKIYADGRGTTKTYDAQNRLVTETDARAIVTTYAWDAKTGLLTGVSFSDGETPAQSFAYDIMGQPTQITDAAGARTLAYDPYGNLFSDRLVAGSVIHLITEARDAYGRTTGYAYAKNSAVQQTVFTGYGTDGRIARAGFVHGGSEKAFHYGYLAGSNLLQTLTMPNNMTLTQSYEAQRDLLTGQVYKRGGTGVAERLYTYNALGIPTTRRSARQGTVRHDVFGYNERSELTSAELGSAPYAYAYDNIGNRKTAQEDAESITYEANELNQYTDITTGEENFIPEYDMDGNQTRIRTGTGIWTAEYNAQNRPTRFTRENADGTRTVITAAYDYLGRRAWKKVETIATDAETGEETATVTLHQRYIYRGYLQVAACDLTRGSHPCLWLITWDPTQPIATRPLAIQKDGTWYCYGWDLTKNICEVFGQAGYIRTTYSYTSYGAVTADGDVIQPLQWSSEYADAELGLVYYNYRSYNPRDGRWIRRDPLDLQGSSNMYQYSSNTCYVSDLLGRKNVPSPNSVVLNYSMLPQDSFWNNTIRACLSDCESKEPSDFNPNSKLIHKQCIKKLRIIAHGAAEDNDGEVVNIEWGDTTLWEDRSLRLISDKFKNIKFCKKCILELLSCHLGESRYLEKRLRENTGCEIKLYKGRVNAFFPF